MVFTVYSLSQLGTAVNDIVDVVELRAQADASTPASNNNINYTIYSSGKLKTFLFEQSYS